MAVPNIDWEEWSQPSIEPFMEAVIHFPSGNKTITDEQISSVDFDISMFDNEHVLFGPPEAATASLSIVDYEQEYNPMKNSTLVDNIQVDLYLGLWPILDTDNLGSNIVTSYDQPILVNYRDEDVYACVVHVQNAYLEPLSRYRLDYTYTVNSTGETYSNYFTVPGYWFERHIYAITQYENYTVSQVQIRKVLPLRQLYGIFYTQEWSHDTQSHLTTIDMISEVSDMLALDNRTSGPNPSAGINLQTFITTLIGLYTSKLVNHLSSSDTVTLPFTFYEDSMAKVLNNGIEALMASLVYAHDGIPHLFQLYWYQTNVTITDEDVEFWEFAQSSVAVYDSIEVSAMVPSLKTDTVLLSMENQTIVYPNKYDFQVDRVWRPQAVRYSIDSTTVPFVVYNFDCLSILWRNSVSQVYDTFEVIGTTVDLVEQVYSNNTGKSPYTISQNGYIPTLDRAQVISTYLSNYIFNDYFIVKMTIRGCYGFWVGAKISVYSALYGIEGDYIITNISFSYSGSVRTEMTLQRIV